MRAVSVRLKEEDIQDVEERAKRLQKTRTELLRKLIEDQLLIIRRKEKMNQSPQESCKPGDLLVGEPGKITIRKKKGFFSRLFGR